MKEQAAKKSREIFSSGFYCAESVLSAVAESLAIQSDLIPRIATGFCSGMARTGSQCGAVSGAMLALGLATGRRAPTESVEPTYALTRELLGRFQEQFGTTNCRALLGCDVGTPEGQQTFRDKHLVEHCLNYVEAATQIALSLLEEQRSKHVS